MNQDEAWIGKVLFIGIAFVCIWAVQALLTAKGEGATRLRLVLGGALALGLIALLFAAAGLVGLVIVLAIGAAVVWIYKGFKK